MRGSLPASALGLEGTVLLANEDMARFVGSNQLPTAPHGLLLPPVDAQDLTDLSGFHDRSPLWLGNHAVGTPLRRPAQRATLGFQGLVAGQGGGSFRYPAHRLFRLTPFLLPAVLLAFELP